MIFLQSPYTVSIKSYIYMKILCKWKGLLKDTIFFLRKHVIKKKKTHGKYQAGAK